MVPKYFFIFSRATHAELIGVKRDKFPDTHCRPAGHPLHAVRYPIIPTRPVQLCHRQRMPGQVLWQAVCDIPRMTRMGAEMMADALDGFVNRNPEKARAVIPRDKEVDLLNKQLHRELANYMVERPTTITRCLNLMVISKSLERIADHATNVAEEVV
jgi:hypothetical protein